MMLLLSRKTMMAMREERECVNVVKGTETVNVAARDVRSAAAIVPKDLKN